MKNNAGFPAPQPATQLPWMDYAPQLLIELRQSLEEGKAVEQLRPLFDAADALPDCPEKQQIADAIFRLVFGAPQRADYPYEEPSDLDGIRAARPAPQPLPPVPEKTVLADKLDGAWYGRIAGCLLGKTVEGIRTPELHAVLRESDNLPLHRYIRRSDVSAAHLAADSFPWALRCYADEADRMPADDDTNYTVMAGELIETVGRDFSPADVVRIWMERQPMVAYCTAERVAYRNFVDGYTPPDSAVYKNPYREWIGAQIRADYFGYINPGDPASAADMAWRDASISHVKNGIYGEMWVAAMLAAAACADPAAPDLPGIVRAGLAQIPAKCRLAEAVTAVLDWHAAGVAQADAFARIHAQWDEFNAHDWCHTISNAMIVTAALLWGGGDYGRSICMAVETGFDTDCNGATVGSVLGMAYGSAAVGAEWRTPLHGRLETQIQGVGTVDITSLIERTLKHIDK